MISQQKALGQYRSKGNLTPIMERTLESQLAPSFQSIEKQSDSDNEDEYSDQFEDEEEDESAYMGSTG